MTEPISITAIASISPLGSSLEEVWASYQDSGHLLVKKEFMGDLEWIAPLRDFEKQQIVALRASEPKYKNLDDSVLYAIYASRNAIRQAQWISEENYGINIGSSRGATSLFEKYHEEFVLKGKASTLSSPTTTLGNISSWVAHDLKTRGVEISHSITCSTALHSLLNAMAWIKSGMAEKFLVGGSEAPLTPFTIAQMKAMKIYSNEETDYPCRAMDLDKNQNTMVLGEGASVACLEKGISENSLAVIEGIGYATEILEHNISISTDAQCFQRSMKMALKGVKPEDVDVIVMHAPGTIKGDSSEFNAIEAVFCKKIPFLTTNKWKVGHTFGASGMLSIELAILMLKYQEVVAIPFASHGSRPSQIKKVMVNAVGFGGNAVSILLNKV